MAIAKTGYLVSNVLMLALGFVFIAQAGTDMTFHGTLIEPSGCTINNDEPIEVEFGNDLSIPNVDGVNYKQNINYNLECVDASSAVALKVLIVGTGASFDSSVLQTTQENLGVKILSNDQPYGINTWLNFSSDSQPILTAVPIKSIDGSLSAGEFTAGATMTVDYQ